MSNNYTKNSIPIFIKSRITLNNKDNIQQKLTNVFKNLNELKNDNSDDKNHKIVAKINKKYENYKGELDDIKNIILSKNFESRSTIINTKYNKSNNDNNTNSLVNPLLEDELNYEEVFDQNKLAEERGQNIKQIHSKTKDIHKTAKDMEENIDLRGDKLSEIVRKQETTKNNVEKTQREAVKTESLTKNSKKFMFWIALTILIVVGAIVVIVIFN